MEGSTKRVLIIVAGVLLVLVGIYAALGTMLAPRLIREQAQEWTKTNLGQDLALGEIKVDPFGFKVDISAIAIPAADPMVSIRHLHLNFAASSIFTDSYRFDAVRIESPQVKAIIGEDGKLNLLKLVPPPNPDPLPPVLISELDVRDGAAFVADYSRSNRPEKRLAPIAFNLQDFHTTRDEGGGFRLTGQSERGEAFTFRGKVSMAPIASHGGLVIRNLRADSIQAFAGDLIPVVLKDGLLSLDVAYAAAYGDAGTTLKAALPVIAFNTVSIAGKPDMLRADISAGSLAIADTRFDLAIPQGGEMESTASVGGIRVRDARLVGTGPAAGEVIALASADIDGISAVPAKGSLSIGAIRLAGLDTSTTRARNGAIGLMALVPPSRPAEAGAAALPMPSIGEFSLTDAKIRLVDKAVTPATTWVVAPLTISARGEETTAGSAAGTGPLKVSISGNLNGKSAFSANGTVDPTAVTADMAVRMANFPIASAVPYTVDYPALRLVSGTASADGRVRYGPKAMGYTGNASVDNLELIETYQNSDLVAFKRLGLTGIDATPNRLVVERATLSAPYGNLIILQDGTLNFQRLVTMNPTPIVTPAADAAPPPKLTRAQRREQEKRLLAEKQATAAAARAALAAPMKQPDIPVLVKRLDIERGTLGFADNSLRPAFAARIEGVNGQITNISNRPDAVAKVKLDGYVIDKFSPVTIAGEINAMQFDRRTRMDVAFRNIELPVFNPYSGRFAGYSIAKGKLTTELAYTIDNRALDAKHHIVIDQLEWGEATDSKEKVSLPLKFATSLLKDKNGVIELDVPVTGTLDDPEFRIGPIVWKIIGNLLEKAVTAPFRALGDLFGGKEDVQFVDFEPGSAAVPMEARSNLSGIAKGLAEKRELRLDIPSGPGLALDATALADRKIASAAMAKEVKKGEAADLATLDPDKRHDRLEDLYKARMKASPNYPEDGGKEEKDVRKARETEWLMAELRKAFQPGPAELATLGRTRAEAVRVALLEGATDVDPARVFLSARDSAAEKDGKARMELKLE